MLLWHLFVIPTQAATGLLGVASRLLSTTWAGVDLFFVLSGFLITGILRQTRARPDFYARFYVRRAARIFPIYLAVMALATAAAWHAGEPWPPAWMLALLVQNFWMVAHSALGPEALAVTWSLAIEEQFYLLFPAVVRRATTRALTVGLCAAVVGAPALRMVARHVSVGWVAPFVLMPCRADALAIGALLSLAVEAGHLPRVRRAAPFLLGLAALNAAYMLYSRHNISSTYADRAGYSGMAIGAGALVAMVLPGEGIAATLARWSPLRALGRISYGVYLFHMPILLMVGTLHGGAFLSGAATFALTIGVAWLSFEGVEGRLIAWSHAATAPTLASATRRQERVREEQ